MQFDEEELVVEDLPRSQDKPPQLHCDSRGVPADPPTPGSPPRLQNAEGSEPVEISPSTSPINQDSLESLS